jgi:hypothetical protein
VQLGIGATGGLRDVDACFASGRPVEREPALRSRSRGTVAQSSRPAVADIFGAGRDATVAITSAVPIPDR